MQYTADGKLIRPTNDACREWIYIGTPITPNALNDGAAPFPVFHSVYVEPKTWEHYQKTGEFMEGAILAKELSRIRAPDGPTKMAPRTKSAARDISWGNSVVLRLP